MYEFIVWLRVIAAIFITNSHFADVWPYPQMAFGGHLGNNVFFLISGFCLYNVKDSFPTWYIKRVIRIYPAVWVTNIIYILTKYYVIDSYSSFIHYFIYPTGFHFVGSIMLLYAVFFLIRFIQKKWHIETIFFMILFFIIFMAAYMTLFERSYYHIDRVTEKWVWFMFTESLLLGAVLREKIDRINDKITGIFLLELGALFMGYFVGKKVFSNVSAAAAFQFMQPMIVSALAANVAILFIKLEKRGIFSQAGTLVRGAVLLLSTMTLEIYLSQDLITTIFENVSFPLSFVAVAGSILIYAFIVHECAKCIQGICLRKLAGIKNRE